LKSLLSLILSNGQEPWITHLIDMCMASDNIIVIIFGLHHFSA